MVGIMSGGTDPLVGVMKVDKAPLESAADVGGLRSMGRGPWALTHGAL